MWKAFMLIIVLFFSSSTLSLKGLGSSPQAKLVHRCESGCSSSSSIMENTADLVHYFSDPPDTVVVRVCSNEPMPLALSIATINPIYLAKWMIQVYNYSPQRILFLRSEDCLGIDSAVAATELWAIPKGAALPSSVESFKSSQAQLEPIGKKDLAANGTHSYKAAANELIAKLRAKPKAVGVVLGYYYKNPSLAIKRRLREVRRILEQSRLPQDRYFVRLASWTGEYAVDPPDPEPRYPSLFIVEVSKSSKQQ